MRIDFASPQSVMTALSAKDAEIERLWAVNETLRKLVRRYRDETPLGHQPHMIAQQVDATLGAYDQQSAREELTRQAQELDMGYGQSPK